MAKDLQSVLADFSILYEQYLQQAISGEKNNKKKNHHTPTWIYELLLIVYAKLELAYQSKEPIKINSQSRECNISSKGGTLDVGIHTGITMPTTSIPVAFSLICYFLGGSTGRNI